MQVYLPIAGVPVDVILILALGLLTGFMAGMFGIGGGFLSTPLLMFIGIPPAVAVSTSSNQIMASSFSGVLAHLKRGNVDIKMGLVMLSGGIIGSVIGVVIFGILQKSGHIDLAVSLIYVVFLGFIGTVMLIDSIKIILERKYDIIFKPNNRSSAKLILLLKKIGKLPFKKHFPKSNITVSIIVPIAIGVVVGTLVSIMGIGGGFIMIPAMIYILKMPSNVVIGTSLFQIIFIAGNVTFLQAVGNQTVDIVLACLMIVSSVIGAQIGTRVGYKVDADNLRSILSLMIIAVCIKMMFGLFSHPENIYNIQMIK